MDGVDQHEIVQSEFNSQHITALPRIYLIVIVWTIHVSTWNIDSVFYATEDYIM